MENKRKTELEHDGVQTIGLKASNGRPTIGYLAPAIHGASQAQWSGVVDAAQKHNVNLICFPGSSIHIPIAFWKQHNILYDLVSTQTVDGVVSWASSIGNYTGIEEIKTFHDRFRPLPVVTIGRSLEGFPGFLMDSYKGMREAIEHLIDVHRYHRIVFIRGPEGHFYAQERYRAYTDVLKAYDLSFDSNLVTPPFSWESSSGMEAMHLLLDERHLRPQMDFEVVVAANDHLLFGALEVLQSRRIHVPGEVAVVGFDDTLQGRTCMPSLTSVAVPYYDVGYRAVETVLAMIDGQLVPDETVVPSKLVVRQSCGCFDPAVLQAAVDQVEGTTLSFEAAFEMQREKILETMRDALEISPKGLLPDWAEHMLDAFSTALKENSPGMFLRAFDNVLRWVIGAAADSSTDSAQNVTAWQNVVSAMEHQVLSCFGNSEADTRRRAENLWRQTRVMIGEAAQQAKATQMLQTDQRAQTLREIEMALITTFDVKGLMDVLAKELPRLHIPSCYLAVYEDPQPYEYPQLTSEWSRLILAYDDQGCVALPPEGQRFPSHCLVPKELLSRQNHYSLVVEPLYFQEHQIGFVVFKIGPREGNIYEILRGEISSALQGDLLVQQVQEHAAEITRQNYVLDTFMETVPDRIYFKDRQGRFTKANQAYAAWVGVDDPAHILGKTEFDFFPEEDACRNFEQEEPIIRTGQPLLDIEEQQAWPDGRVDWSLTTKMPLCDEHGQIIGMFGISRDITDLKHTEQKLVQYRDHLEDLVEERTAELTRSNARLHEEIIERSRVEHALRVSEQQYRLLAETVIDGIVIMQDGKLVFANAAFAAMVRRSLNHLLGSDPVTLFPDHVKQTAYDRLACKDHGDTEPQWQVEVMTGDGRTIWTEINLTAMMWNNRPALLLTVRNITQRKLREIQLEQERARLQQENLTFKSMSPDRYRFGPLVGKSPAMQRVYDLIVSAATSDVNVLVVGESGTGKELIARTLHQVSTRKRQAFVPVNCASIPETLFEREFFGHRKGAFTGADRDKPGLFDRAHQGTLFLDEVTELSPGTQAKLLRVLQDGEYTPLGSNTSKQANVLIIAATNGDCQIEIEQGRLRKDFFYRIGVIEISVPPLRERKEDLPLLIEHILDRYRQKQAEMHGSVPHDLPTDQTMLPGDLIQTLYAYDWPGNVRELQNVLQRYLATKHLDAVIPLFTNSRGIHTEPEVNIPSHGMTLSETVQVVEKQIIADLLARNRYHKSKTAKMLGISRSTLNIKIKQYQL
jgi:PAS domain S-box-containing protein